MNSSPEQQKKRKQVMDSLRKANKVKSERAAMKRRLRDATNRGEALDMLARWIEERHPIIEGERVSRLLLSCRRCGPTFQRNFLRAVQVGDYVTVEQLSDKRREYVVTSLRRNGIVPVR